MNSLLFIVRLHVFACQAALLDAVVAEALKEVKAVVYHKVVGTVTFIPNANKLEVASAINETAEKHGLSDASLLTLERLSIKLYSTEEEVKAAEVRVGSIGPL